MMSANPPPMQSRPPVAPGRGPGAPPVAPGRGPGAPPPAPGGGPGAPPPAPNRGGPGAPPPAPMRGPGAPPPAPAGGGIDVSDPQYDPFKKMLKIGVPKQSVANKLQQNGLDPDAV